MIPHDWRRFQLSELINKVLGNTDAAVPFDFIIDEKLLRSSLGEWTKARGLTEETVLDVEYVESILPPRTLSPFEQEDWVSDIDLSQKE
jgi:ribosome biogenesis protein YTM1